jgi:hypothetical protein
MVAAYLAAKADAQVGQGSPNARTSSLLVQKPE